VRRLIVEPIDGILCNSIVGKATYMDPDLEEGLISLIITGCGAQRVL
jgi:hypothetical protein